MPKCANDQKRIKDLRQERCKLVADARKIQDAAEAEGRSMRAEEKGSWEEIMKKVDELGERIGNLERMADASDEDEDEDRDDTSPPSDEEDEEEDEDEDEDDDERSGKFIVVKGKRYRLQKVGLKRRTQPGGKLPSRRMPWETQGAYETRKRRSSPEYRQVFMHFLMEGESALRTKLAQRAIQADSDIVGGYLVAPLEFQAQLIKFVNNFVFVRTKATRFVVKAAQSLGAPSLDTDPDDADWTSELNTGNEDNAMSFGKRELTPHPLAKRIKVSRKLLRMAAISGGFSQDGSVSGGGAEGLVRDRLGYKFGVSEEKAFLLGTGANQPLGLFTPSSKGISTNRDVQTAGAGTLTGDDLISAKYNLKVQYWPDLEWIFHRDVLQSIRKLKDSYGQYLWVPGGFGGESDKLLDVPVNMSEYAPSTIASGDYVGLLGALKFYWVVDSETLEIQRLDELYAAANQVGFIARQELDGMPVLEEAFTRIKVQ